MTENVTEKKIVAERKIKDAADYQVFTSELVSAMGKKNYDPTEIRLFACIEAGKMRLELDIYGYEKTEENRLIYEVVKVKFDPDDPGNVGYEYIGHANDIAGDAGLPKHLIMAGHGGWEKRLKSDMARVLLAVIESLPETGLYDMTVCHA